MKFAWFLALRYLKPKRTFISIITVISILGVTLGVGVLIVVIAVMSGFERRIKDEWLKVEPPVYLYDDTRSFFGQIEEPGADGQEPKEPEWRGLLRQLKSFKGVQNASAFINVVTLMQTAPQREHDDMELKMGPGDTPPGEPPPPEPDPSAVPAPVPQPAPSTAPGPGTETSPPPPPPSSPENGPQGDPARAGAAAPPATPPLPHAGPESADKPATDETQDLPIPPDATDAAGQAPPDKTAKEQTQSVTGLDRTRPLAPAVIIGVDTDDPVQMEKMEKRFRELRERIRTRPDGQLIPSAWGEFDISGETMVLSEEVARKLSSGEIGPIHLGSRGNLFGPSYINEGINIVEEQRQAKDDKEKQAEVEAKDRDYPLPMDLSITGIFDDDKQSGGPQGGVGYVSLMTAQRLAGAGKAVDGIYVELADPYEAQDMVDRLMEAGLIPPGWHAETWMQRHRQQFEAVANERSMMYIVLGFISLVAAFCIGNTMITFAVQKRREIGMMRALGAKTSHIVGLFMTKGFIVGFLGTTLGYLTGQLVLYYRNGLRDWINNTFGHQIFDAAIYGLNEIPAELRVTDQVIICSVAMVLCVVASMVPSFLVGQMEPARALRNDR